MISIDDGLLTSCSGKNVELYLTVVNTVVTFFILLNFPSLGTPPWDLWFYCESSRAMLRTWNVDLRPSIHSWWSHSYYLDFFWAVLLYMEWLFFFNALLFLSFTERPTYLNSSAALKLFLPHLSWISTEITFWSMGPPTSNEYSKFMSHLRKRGTMFEGHHFHLLQGRIRHTQPSTFRGQLEPVNVIVFYNWEPLMTSVKLLRNSRSETHVEAPYLD